MRSKNNTKQKGIARIFIFPEKDKYKAVCLDFDLIEEARTIKEVEKKITKVIAGYITTVCKNNLDDQLLNRHTEEKYWKMYEAYNKYITAKRSTNLNTPSKIKKSALLTMPLLEFVKNSKC